MTATTAMIKQVRRMVAEPNDSNEYDDDVLKAYIEEYPLIDERGENPFTWDTSTSPPTQDSNADWLATYCLHSAAAKVWSEKAAAIAHLYSFSADGGNFKRSNIYEQYMQTAVYHQARRSPKTIRAFVWPEPKAVSGRDGWIANLAEQD